MIYLATDHAGFELKESVKGYLESIGYEVEDFGASAYNAEDDYPDFISMAADAVSNDPESKAVIFGSSGQGEAIVANKYPRVRAVVFYGPIIAVHNVDVSGRTSVDPYEMIKLTREHNDANVLSIGAKIIEEDDAKTAIKVWLETDFSGEERHVRRIEKITKLEEKLYK